MVCNFPECPCGGCFEIWYRPASAAAPPFHNALVGAASKYHRVGDSFPCDLSIMPLWGLLRNQATLPHRFPCGAAIFSHGGGNGKDTPAPKQHSQSGSCAAHPKVSHSVKLPKGVKQSEKRASPSDTSQRIIARRSLAHGEANSKPKTRRGGFSMYGGGKREERSRRNGLQTGAGWGRIGL